MDPSVGTSFRCDPAAGARTPVIDQPNLAGWFHIRYHWRVIWDGAAVEYQVKQIIALADRLAADDQ